MTVLRASRRVLPLLGGQEIHVGELTRALAQIGVDQTLAYGDGSPDLPPRVRGRQLRVPTWAGHIATDVLFGGRLFLTRWAHAEVVHTHGDSPVARAGSLVARSMRAAHVHTFHGSLVNDRIRGTLLRAFLPRGSWYLAVSEKIAGDLTSCGVAPTRVLIRPSGVRSLFFRISHLQRQPIVVIGGRLVPVRQVREFARAWASERIEGVSLHVFGDGPEAPLLAALAAEVEGIKWLGRLDEAEMASTLGGAAVGVVLSKAGLTEGTPTLALEMLAAGCAPIVSDRAGAVPSLVRELQFGATVADLPSPQIVARMAKAYSGSERDDQRARIRAHVHHHYGWEAVASTVYGLYRDITGNSGACRPTS